MADGTDNAPTLQHAPPTLRFAGQVDERASELVEAMTMNEDEGGMRSLELKLIDWASTSNGGAGIAFEDSVTVRLGAPIEVYGGHFTGPMELFRGYISSIECCRHRGQAPHLLIRAEDALFAARMARRSQVFTNKTPAEIVKIMTANLGLTLASSSHVEGPALTWVQMDETDLGFLRRMLLRFDADLQVVAGELHVSPRGDVKRAEIELTGQDDLRTIRVCADLAEQVTATTVRGWDEERGAAVKGQVREGGHLGPGAGRTGATVLAATLGERPDNLGHLSVRSQAEATAVAEAAFDRRARRFVRAEGVANGKPELRVGAHLRLSGLGTRFDNVYYVVSTRHHFDRREGYSTRFVAECAYLGGRH